MVKINRKIVPFVSRKVVGFQHNHRHHAARFLTSFDVYRHLTTSDGEQLFVSLAEREAENEGSERRDKRRCRGPTTSPGRTCSVMKFTTFHGLKNSPLVDVLKIQPLPPLPSSSSIAATTKVVAKNAANTTNITHTDIVAAATTSCVNKNKKSHSTSTVSNTTKFVAASALAALHKRRRRTISSMFSRPAPAAIIKNGHRCSVHSSSSCKSINCESTHQHQQQLNKSNEKALNILISVDEDVLVEQQQLELRLRAPPSTPTAGHVHTTPGPTHLSPPSTMWISTHTIFKSLKRQLIKLIGW